MNPDPINSRIFLLMASFPQSIAVCAAILIAWLPAAVRWEKWFSGKPLPPGTQFLLELSEAIAPAKVFCYDIAMATAGAHFFVAFALIWSSRDRRRFQFRWCVFSIVLWILLFGWALIQAVFLVIPFISIIMGMHPVTPPSKTERIVDFALPCWLILLAVASFVIYKKDRNRGQSEGNPS